MLSLCIIESWYFFAICSFIQRFLVFSLFYYIMYLFIYIGLTDYTSLTPISERSRCGCLSLSFLVLLVDNGGRFLLLLYLREIMQAKYLTTIAFTSLNIVRQLSDENNLRPEHGESGLFFLLSP
jgi:hypothetical protein